MVILAMIQLEETALAWGCILPHHCLTTAALLTPPGHTIRKVQPVYAYSLWKAIYAFTHCVKYPLEQK